MKKILTLIVLLLATTVGVSAMEDRVNTDNTPMIVSHIVGKGISPATVCLENQVEKITKLDENRVEILCNGQEPTQPQKHKHKTITFVLIAVVLFVLAIVMF